MIYPDSRWKPFFDIFIALLLIYTCNAIPVQLAFETGDTDPFDSSSITQTISNIVIDAFFVTDIILMFFTALVDENLNVIDDLGTIAYRYCISWLVIDVVSIIPFEFFFYSPGNRMLRIARLGKLYRFLKLFRLLRITKLFKSNNAIGAQFQDNGYQQLALMFFSFVMASHILACMWLFIAQFGDDDENDLYKGSWAASYMKDPVTNSNSSMYLISIYWVMTTLSTVGYGDISATNGIE